MQQPCLAQDLVSEVAREVSWSLQVNGAAEHLGKLHLQAREGS